MATYVFSDIHGHVEPLRRALERINPTESDVFYCLGDMIDRGPSSLATIKTIRSLPNCTVLMGNHEQLALQALDPQADIETQFMWQINGGDATLAELKSLPEEEYCELIGWLHALPLYATVEVEGRDFVLVHAGVKHNGVPLPTTWDKTTLEQYLSKQSENDLLWIREEFWQYPTDFRTSDTSYPIIICGHTPTPLLASFGAKNLNRSATTPDGLAQWVQSDGDKWGIDTGTTGGAGYGQVTILRLDDLQEFVEPLQEGE